MLGGWLSMPTSMSAEAMAKLDLDYVVVDMQHGIIDYSDSVPMLQAITTGTATPMVRVPQNQFAYIGKALDAGAMGVIVPMVNSVGEAVAAVEACYYPPLGGRSYGPSRVMHVEGPDYWERANDTVACIPMIETVQALEALDDIVAVPGVRAVYVGPADLSISMGLHPREGGEDLHRALDLVVETCRRHDVIPGVHATPATAPDRLARGFRMVTVTADLVALRAKLSDDVDAIRGVQRDGSDSIY